MRKRTLLGSAVAAAALMLAGGLAAQAQEYVFTLHHFLGAQVSAQTGMLEPWARAVEANSGGRVRIEIYPAMSLGGRPQELVQQVRDGVVDLIWTVNGYTPGLFPRTEVFELPFVFVNDPAATNIAMNGMFAEYLADDYAGMEVMFLHVHAGQGIQMADRPVHGPADLAGAKMRIPTRTGAWVIEALGASPVAMPVPDLPQALQKGVVDGAFIPWEIIPALKIEDQTRYLIEGAERARFGATTFQVSMNQARWDGLPEDIRKAFREASGPEWWAEVGRIWRASEERGLAIAVAAGNEHVTLTAAQTAAFRSALEPVVQRWIDEVSGHGIDGAALVAAARAGIARNATPAP